MYNFAVVIDDYDMDITHVLRGEEHLSNTPYQIAIKQALGFDTKGIQYGHLPIIIDETGKKLSKRNQTLKQFIEDYRNMGFLPEAINNFLVLIGWSPKSKQEIMNLNTMINEFDLERISKAPATFDYNKMLWIAKEHIQHLDTHAYINFVKKFINFDTSVFDDKLNDVLLLFQKQISYAQQLNELVKTTFFSNSHIKSTNIKLLQSLKQNIEQHDNITPELASTILKNVQQETQLKGKDLYMPIRLLLTGNEHGPELNKIMAILGKEKILGYL
jgi:glutamyl-tRNA synthetase